MSSHRYTVNNMLTEVTSDMPMGGFDVVPIKAIGDNLIKKGEGIVIVTPHGMQIKSNVTADVSDTATSISIDRVTPNYVVPIGSIIMYDGPEVAKKIIKKDVILHLTAYQAGGNNGKDFLPNYSQDNYNVNTNVVLADGNSKPNKWGAEFSRFIAPADCTIKSVKGYATTNGGSNEQLYVSLWGKEVLIGSSSNTNVSEVISEQVVGGETENDVKEFSVSDVDYTLQEGYVLIPTIRRAGTLASGVKWYVNMTITVQYNV